MPQNTNTKTCNLKQRTLSTKDIKKDQNLNILVHWVIYDKDCGKYVRARTTRVNRSYETL